MRWWFRGGWSLAFACCLVLGAGNPSRVNQVLVELKEGKASSRIEISEDDLNAWLAVALDSRRRLGVKSAEVDLRGLNRVRATAVVDMDQVQLEGFSVRLFKAVLSGEQTLVTEGRLEVSRGQGHFQVESASFNGVAVPAWLASSVISYLSSRQPPHVDVTEPFDLPYGLRDLELLSDRAVILR
jgi:hypothetical protein